MDMEISILPMEKLNFYVYQFLSNYSLSKLLHFLPKRTEKGGASTNFNYLQISLQGSILLYGVVEADMTWEEILVCPGILWLSPVLFHILKRFSQSEVSKLSA